MPTVSNLLARYPISVKIGGLVGLLLLLLAVTGGVSVLNMTRIGDELVEIAEHDLPLTERVTQVSEHQLAQAVQFERALRHGSAAADGDAGEAAERLEGARGEFTELSESVEHELDSTIARLDELVAESSGASAEEWKALRAGFADARAKHATFDEHAFAALDALAAGRTADLDEKIEAIEAEEDALNHELEELQAELMSFTKQAAVTAEHHEQSALKIILAVLAGSLVLGAGLAYVLVRGITAPLKRVIHALDALGRGDTSQEIEAQGRDEVAQLTQAYAVFRDKTIENERLRQEQEEAEKRAEEDKKRALNDMADRFEKDVGQVVQSVGSAGDELNSSAQSMSSIAEETGRQATSVSSAAEQSAGNVQTVASAAEELSASIQEISQQVSRSTEIAKGARDRAGKATEQVQSLNQAAEKIGNVIGLIEDIAEQTNLLALNATIEAARAGEAGKGFAVVAQEVKNLASQTAKATQDISDQIQSVQSETRDAASAIEQISASIKEIDEITSSVAAAVEEQEASTGEISRNVQEAANGTQEVTSNIAGVSQAAGEAGSAAEQVVSACGELNQQSAVLREKVDGFLAEVRAG